MNKRVFLTISLCLLLFVSLEAESSVTYFSGFSYTNTILKGSAAWDHLDQVNVLTGFSFSGPLEGTDLFNRKIRVSMDLPLVASIRQLDGDLLSVLELDSGNRFGFNLFFGPELPLELKKNIFQFMVSGGPLIDVQTLNGALLLTAGAEVTGEARISLNDRFYTGMGASLYSHLWGLHTAGDSTRYDIYIQSGLGVMINSFIGFRY